MTDLAPRDYDVSLFDAPITAGTHRHGDPITSTLAAQAKDPGPDQAAALAALVANGGTGTLDTACAALPSRDRGCVSRRLTDLEADGAIRATGEHVEGAYGRPLAVWTVVR